MGGISEGEPGASMKSDDFYNANPSDRCGKFNGYNVWMQFQRNENGVQVNDCFDADAVDSDLEVYFDKNLNSHLGKYTFDIPRDYQYKFSGATEVTGIASYPLIFDISNIKTATQQKPTLTTGANTPVTTKPGIPVSQIYFGKLNDFTNKRSSSIAVEKIILHHTGDSAASQTFATLKQRKLSVHYITDRDGTIYYVVDESLTAWHAIGTECRFNRNRDCEQCKSSHKIHRCTI